MEADIGQLRSDLSQIHLRLAVLLQQVERMQSSLPVSPVHYIAVVTHVYKTRRS